MTLQQFPNLIEDLQISVRDADFWSGYLNAFSNPKENAPSLHLAVFVEPYLKFVLDGHKTMESRFSIHRCAPYNRVREGDVLMLKSSGGPVVGLCRVQSAWFYQLDSSSLRSIRERYAQSLCVQDPQFWTDRQAASYATLMSLDSVLSIAPMQVPKRDRRGWVVLREGGALNLSSFSPDRA